MKLPRSFAKLKKLVGWRSLLPIAAAIVVAVAAAPMITGNGSEPTVLSHQEDLRKAVDTNSGAPRSGRDPATQPQSNLAAAASSPHGGAGQRVDKPAAGITGDRSHTHKSSDVLNNPEQTGIASNGCYLNYGVPGEQCLPAHAAEGGKLTCESLHNSGFHHGVTVIGKDRFNLDHNGDGIACGPSD